MERFRIDEYLKSLDASQKKSTEDAFFETDTSSDYSSFFALCRDIKRDFFADWEKNDNSKANLEVQKKAIIGYEKEKTFFKMRIEALLKEKEMENCPYPSWYENLSDAVYHENWGLAGLAEWFSEEFSKSSSAKIIGEKIYFMDRGRMVKREQSISPERKNQMIKAFLLLTPEERMDKAYHETYLLDGTRVTIFLEPMAKKGQSCLIFRRYLIPELTFEEQALRNTIPKDSIRLFKAMVNIGFNVVFLGAVRTAKTTFLTTWQRCEDPALEGVMVETDPEIPMQRILPDAPILQLIADGSELSRISKNLMRSDADYFIMAEARDGIALDTAVRIAAKGTKRMKLTFHSRLPQQFPLEAAMEIVKMTGGDLNLTMKMIANSFDYLFHFVQLSDKSQKRLKGIYEMSCDEKGEIRIVPLCEYNIRSGTWKFYNTMSEDKIQYAIESNYEAYDLFRKELKRLSECTQI